VSRRAAELESRLIAVPFDGALVRDLLGGIREAYAADIVHPPDWAGAQAAETPRTVLIVEDDPDQLALLEIQLQRAGHRTVSVTRGDGAVNAARERWPSIVLLDVDLPGLDGYAVLVLDLMMPAMSGFDVLMHLQQRPSRPRTIVLSARGREEDVTRAFDLGADDYVVKPFSPQELRARILRLLK